MKDFLEKQICDTDNISIKNEPMSFEMYDLLNENIEIIENDQEKNYYDKSLNNDYSLQMKELESRIEKNNILLENQTNIISDLISKINLLTEKIQEM